MTSRLLGSGVLDPIGADARGPVLIAFLVFIGVALLWIFMLAAAEYESPEKFYVANRSLSPVFNGMAMAGEHISVLTLLGASGIIALFGYDGVPFVIDSLLTLGVALFLAQKLREKGRYTLGDLFAVRAEGPAPRVAANLVTLAITVPILIVQLRAAGISTALVIGLPTAEAQVVCTVLMGGLVTCFAVLGGLRATSFMHVVKVPLTLVTLAVIALLAVRKFSWDPGRLLGAAVDKSAAPDDYLSPGLWPYTEYFGPFNTFGNHIVVILGAAMMPHLILRLNASNSGREARRTMAVAVGILGVFFLLLIAAGFAAAAVVGGPGIAAVDTSGQSSLISLASGVLSDGSAGRAGLITAVACVIFIAVLTTVTSVTFAAGVSLAHDTRAWGKSMATHGAEARAVRAVRVAVFVMGVAGLSLAAATHRFPMEFLGTFSMSVAASCIFPALTYTFFWHRFNRRGLLWSVYAGLLLCTILTLFSPTVSGAPFALWPEVDFSWYPFQTPGLVSVPAAFLFGWLGSLTSTSDAAAGSPAAEDRIPVWERL